MISFCRSFFVLTLCFVISACGESVKMTDSKFFSEKISRNMELASTWIIEDGISSYYLDGVEKIKRRLIDDWGVQIWVDPWVDADRYIAQFRIKSRGINYDIHSLYRERVDRKFYEFWVSKISAKEWSGEKPRSVFFVTKADDIRGKRMIVDRSDTFIENYKVSDEYQVSFPIENLEVIYDMQPWLFPENYKGTSLSGVKVVMDADGKIFRE